MNKWFFTSGDLGFFWKETIGAFSWFPKIFTLDQHFGYSSLLSLWLDYPFRVVVKLLSTLGFSWFVIEKLLWALVFILAIYSSYKLARSWIASVIYSTNTYILLLFSGGQLGVALAYGFAPFVLYKFIEGKRPIANGLWLALLMVFDLRIAYLLIAAILLYVLIYKKPLVSSIGLPLLVACSVHMFWILPTLLTGTGPLTKGADFTNPGMLKFLSVADFSHALSFLHPNWPENLFGKVYFLQPEFLMIPILAFSSLFFPKRSVFFAALALIGVFFAKGTQPPFGFIYEWMFLHVPGFVMFRDPTKFYLYTAIGYSILIPYAISKIPKKLRIAGVSVFICFWLFSIRAVFTGQVKGNFRPLALSQEYIQLKDMLVKDAVPSRVLWIPTQDKFSYYSDTHPLLTFSEVFPQASVSAIPEIVQKSDFQEIMNKAGAGYIIVPNDLEKRIFVSDYTYDPEQRETVIRALNNTNIQRVGGFRTLAVYKNEQFVFKNDIPGYAAKQQRYANIGFYMSLFVLSVTIPIAVKRRKH